MTAQIVFYVDRAGPHGVDVDSYLSETAAHEAALARGLDYYYRHEQHFVDEQLVHASWERVDV